MSFPISSSVKRPYARNVLHGPRTLGRVSAVSDAIYKNIVTDFGAVFSPGDSSTAFNNFNTWGITQTKQVVLTVPAGTYETPTAIFWQRGILNLTVNGYGAIFNSETAIGWGATYQDSTNKFANFETVSTGASAVVLTDASKASLFTVGQYVLLAGIDLQGYGFPQNQYIFEYIKILAIDAISGTISFTTKLQNSYKSTYPLYDPGVPPFQPYQGGPATIYVLYPEWIQTLVLNGIKFAGGSNSAVGGARFVTVNDCDFSELMEAAPTAGIQYTANRCIFSAIEMDKILVGATFNQCSAPSQSINFQSSDGAQTTILNGWTGGVVGVPENLTIAAGSTVSPLAVSCGFGMSKTLNVLNSTISVFKTGGLVYQQNITDGTYANGILRMPSDWNSGLPIPWAVPEAKIIYAGANYNGNFGVAFTVVDLSKDEVTGETVIATDGPASFTTFSGVVTPTKLLPVPCLDVSVTNCVGCAEIVDLSNAPKNGPLWEYASRTYTFPYGGGSPPYVIVWGTLVSLSINVTKSYTGVQSSLAYNAGGPLGIYTINSSGVVALTWNPVVNLKKAGERIITSGGVVGQQSGDTGLAVPYADPWLPFYIQPYAYFDISGEDPSTYPIMTITVHTRQW